MYNSTTTSADTNPNKGDFLKSMIRIAHPDWTMEQIEAEAQRQLNANENGEEGCIACGS